jgi:hypothetical protein
VCAKRFWTDDHYGLTSDGQAASHLDERRIPCF